RKRDGSTCAGNAECENDACIGGSCTSPSGILDPCDDSTDCQSNLACTGGFCLVPDGSPCADDPQCVNLCIVDTCEPSQVGLREDCGEDEDCASGRVCLSGGGLGECRIPNGSQEPCEQDFECEGACFDSRCDELRELGQGCERGSQCVTGNCIGGACLP
ncbi:MAG: hypothetical protein AAF219_08600, partial [Myxococcota bacterium]